MAAHERGMREQAKKMGVASLRSGEQSGESAEAKLAKVRLLYNIINKYFNNLTQSNLNIVGRINYHIFVVFGMDAVPRHQLHGSFCKTTRNSTFHYMGVPLCENERLLQSNRLCNEVI